MSPAASAAHSLGQPDDQRLGKAPPRAGRSVTVDLPRLAQWMTDWVAAKPASNRSGLPRPRSVRNAQPDRISMIAMTVRVCGNSYLQVGTWPFVPFGLR